MKDTILAILALILFLVISYFHIMQNLHLYYGF